MPYTVSPFYLWSKSCLMITDFIVERNFNVGKFMDVDLELRTSEVNGILMSVAEPINGFPAFSLEISNGNVSIMG